MSKTPSAAAKLTRQLLALAMASVFLAGSAAAQTRAPAPATSPVSELGTGKPGAHTITYKQKTSYDFDEEEVDGSTVRPEDSLITSRPKAIHDSLIQPRTTFMSEMLKSVETM